MPGPHCNHEKHESISIGGLPQAAIHAICQVFACYSGLSQSVLYGSRSKGTFRSGSDIDLTLKGDITDQKLLNMYGDLYDLCLPYKIDLSLCLHLDNQALREHIKRVVQVFLWSIQFISWSFRRTSTVKRELMRQFYVSPNYSVRRLGWRRRNPPFN